MSPPLALAHKLFCGDETHSIGKKSNFLSVHGFDSLFGVRTRKALSSVMFSSAIKSGDNDGELICVFGHRDC